MFGGRFFECLVTRRLAAVDTVDTVDEAGY